jgi:hypothetical protein
MFEDVVSNEARDHLRMRIAAQVLRLNMPSAV